MASRPDLKRRRVCVLSLDVVGYSRMMARDDMMAVAALRDARGIIVAEAGRGDGRIFGTAGDILMLDFAGALPAVHGAVRVQNAIFLRNQGLPDAEQIWLRAGMARRSASV